MYTNWYELECLMKGREADTRKIAEAAWKQPSRLKKTNTFRLPAFFRRQRQSVVCCSPLPCC